MKTIQLSYPWQNSKLLELENVSFLQIGIECPHVFPLEHLVEHNKNFEAIVNIKEGGSNNKSYTISDREILEFSEMYFSSLSVSVAKVSNPYIIIDIAYE